MDDYKSAESFLFIVNFTMQTPPDLKLFLDVAAGGKYPRVPFKNNTINSKLISETYL